MHPGPFLHEEAHISLSLRVMDTLSLEVGEWGGVGGWGGGGSGLGGISF